MRRSRFTDDEILHLLVEAGAGVPMAEICKAAGITERTFYRWRRQLGGLDVPAVREMKGLAAENQRLRNMIGELTQRLRADEVAGNAQRASKAAATPVETRRSDQARASRIAAEKCGGAVTGRFASVRVHP
jgi:putative transposase